MKFWASDFWMISEFGKMFFFNLYHQSLQKVTVGHFWIEGTSPMIQCVLNCSVIAGNIGNHGAIQC